MATFSLTRSNKRAAHLLITCLCAFLLMACGWQLRGLNNKGLPSALSVSMKDRLAPFSLILIENLRNFSIELDNTAALKLTIGEETIEKRTVAVTNIGTAAQYEVRLTIHYLFTEPRTSPSQTTQTNSSDDVIIDMQRASAIRLFDFETGANLSKTREENLLLDEMRNEIALKIIQASRRYSNGKN